MIIFRLLKTFPEQKVNVNIKAPISVRQLYNVFTKMASNMAAKSLIFAYVIEKLINDNI